MESQEGNVQLDIGLLIEMVQMYPFIFDMTNKDYKDGKKKEMAWKEISDITGSSVKDCMNCWRNVRDRFVREKNKGQSGSEAPTVWPYYDKMLFYAKYSKRRHTYSSVHREKIIKPPNMHATPSTSKTSTDVIWGTDGFSSPNSPESEVQEEASNTNATPVGAKKFKGVTATPCSSKIQAKTNETGLEKVIETAKNIATLISTRYETKNSNRTFADYVYFRLEEMSPEEAGKKRKDIFKIIEDL